jgi:hypothetical protein
MKLIITLALVLSFSTSYSQWTKAEQLPAAEIASFYHKGDTLYAGGKNIVYISKDNGLSWDATNTISSLHFLITSMIVYKNEWYAAGLQGGAYKTAVKTQRAALLSGNNQLSIDTKLLVNGFCHLYIQSDNGLLKKTVQLVKQKNIQ